MLADLQINSLVKALRRLTWLIGLALVLLVGSMVSFKYAESEADTAQLAESRMIANDTLSKESFSNIISMSDLLATPEKYHNQPIQVKGYLNLEFEGNALYWHKSDYYSTYGYKNACWVEFSDSLLREKRVQNYSGRYVIVKGIFDATRNGHMSLFSGEIRSISSLNSLQEKVR